MRLFSFSGNGLALTALALAVFGAIECIPNLRLAKPCLSSVHADSVSSPGSPASIVALNALFSAIRP